MTEREMLQRAVCENPDDDTPRLVFADWRDENGEPERAEFIRIQVGTERIPLRTPTGQEMFVRERELLCAHEPCWRASLPDPFHPHPFVRGFVEAATIDHQQPFRVADLEALFVAAPLVDLTIHSLHDPGMLAAVPATSRLRTLTVGLSDASEKSLWNCS
jgi:uncharacterized protein (TIGR02996 family)